MYCTQFWKSQLILLLRASRWCLLWLTATKDRKVIDIQRPSTAEKLDGGRGRWRWWLIFRRHSPLPPSVLFPPNRLSLLELWISWRQIFNQTIYFGGLLLGKDYLQQVLFVLESEPKDYQNKVTEYSNIYHVVQCPLTFSPISLIFWEGTRQMQQGC